MAILSPSLLPYDAPLPPSVPSVIPFLPPRARESNLPARSFSSASATTSSKSPCPPAIRRDTPARARAKPCSAPEPQSRRIVKPLHVFPMHIQSHEQPLWSARVFRRQRFAPDKIFLLQIHHLSQSQFVRRIFLRLNQRPLAAGVVHLQHDQPGLNPRHVQRNYPRRMQIKRPPIFHQRVPNPRRILPRHPYLVAQIARISRPRNIHFHSADFSVHKSKIFQIRNICFRHFLQQAPRCRPLQRQRCHFVRNVFHLHVQPQRILVKPANARIRRRPAVRILAQPRNRPVINHFPLLVAPAAVNHLPDRHLIDVPRDHPVHEFRRVLPLDPVFV